MERYAVCDDNPLAIDYRNFSHLVKTGRDSTGKESKHIKISAINVVGGRRTGYRSHTQSAERLEELEDNVWSGG